MAEPTVAVYPADETACGNYRVIWPAKALAAQGHDIAILPPGHPKRLQATVRYAKDGEPHVDRVVLPDADVLVFQRPLNLVFVEAMEKLSAAGKRIVVELDDDFERVSPSNGAYFAVHPKRSPRANWLHLRRALKVADALVVSTPALRRYAPPGVPCTVVENRVPAWFLDLPHDPSPMRPGWTGSLAVHPHDLQVMGPAVKTVLRKLPDVEGFHVVGNPNGVALALGLAPIQVKSSGWVNGTEYPKALATEITVAVTPLEDTAFNRAKSWLKPLELAAVGVPSLMSPLPEYQRLAAFGIGRLCSKPKNWAGDLAAMLADPDLRAEESAKARAAVSANGLVIEDAADEWWKAWTAGL